MLEIWIYASCKHKKISKNKYEKKGDSTIAFVVKRDGIVIDFFSSYVGVLDNNQAEYEALLAAINYVIDNDITDVIFYTDSSLLERQMNNKYSCNSPLLHPYYIKAKKMIKTINKYSIVWIKRTENKYADELCSKEHEKINSGREDANEKID